jgi:cyclase
MTKLEELADGVWAWLQPGGESGVSNAGVIADDDGLTVVDTLMVRSQWEPFGAAVAALGAPVRRVVLTHAHIDHVGGTKLFPLASVYASPQTSKLLEQPPMTDAYKAFMPAFAAEFDDLAETGTRQATHEVDGPAQLTARVELLPANGHTDGDLMVLVADADILFAGDLCFFGVTPLAFQGDPGVWAEVVTTFPDLATRIVPGHGPVGGEDEIEALRGYLGACVDAKGDPRAIPPGPWDAWVERDRDTINVERAAMLARGDDGMPPAMLKAIGLA